MRTSHIAEPSNAQAGSAFKTDYLDAITESDLGGRPHQQSGRPIRPRSTCTSLAYNWAARSLGPDANVDGVSQDGRAVIAGPFAHHVIERLANDSALTFAQPEAAKHFLDNRIAPNDPVP